MNSILMVLVYVPCYTRIGRVYITLYFFALAKRQNCRLRLLKPASRQHADIPISLREGRRISAFCPKCGFAAKIEVL